MKLENEGNRSILSALIAAIFFILLLFVLKWNFFVTAGLAVLLFFGLSFLLTPIKKIGNVAVETMDQGQRLSLIYDRASFNLRGMEHFQEQIKDREVSGKAKALTDKGNNILKYLSNNPKTISTSEHFLNYYLDTANRILDNYVEMQESNVSEGKQALIYKETSDSIDYLQEIFTKQLDSYYDEKILSLEVESDLLEKTVKLGGGRK